MTTTALTFPLNPLDRVTVTTEDRRRTISGILESYHGSYDMLVEALQNAVDAIEDARVLGLPEPFVISVEINLAENWFSVLDTGVGMTPAQIAEAFAPNVSFKDDPGHKQRRGTLSYRGYKGVGLTLIAYGTDDVALHSKRDGQLVRTRMQYGRQWTVGDRQDPALVVEDTRQSPLEKLERGTFAKVQFSAHTRPKSLARLANRPDSWRTILRTRTAVGQILMPSSRPVDFKVELRVTEANGIPPEYEVPPTFLFPHLVTRKPPFRFLNLNEYFQTQGEHTTPPADKLRQDGVYLVWDTARIRHELTEQQQLDFDAQLKKHTPVLYAFVPYQASVWGEINEILTGVKNRTALYPGLLLAVNRQRLADKFEIEASRFATFSQNVMVLVHFDGAKPDQGRKTLEDELVDLAKRASDRAVQYLAKQRALLKPAGDAPTPGQRDVEKSFEDWVFNVRRHQETSPLSLQPLSFLSTPLTEQDVVGLFHQLSALKVFPGLEIFATSQIQTYDCLVRFKCSADMPGLRYVSVNENPLGVAPYILGTSEEFSTKNITVEFKNNLDALVAELGSDTAKNYRNINICVCWSKVGDTFDGYALEAISEHNLEERAFPGVTHILRRDGDSHVIQVMMLSTICDMIKAGNIVLTQPGSTYGRP